MSRRRRRSAPTPAQIWRILHASAREAREARRKAAEMAERFQEAEEARKQAEEARRQAEEERLRLDAERDRKLERELYKLYGEGDNRWGRLIEALVQGNVKKMFRDAGIDVEDALARRRSRIGGIWREYDLVAVGESDAVVVEVKTTLRVADVKVFAERIGDFRKWRWDDARPRVWGALAYLSAEGNAAWAAEDAGFYLIQAVSGSARLVNSEGFEPRVF